MRFRMPFRRKDTDSSIHPQNNAGNGKQIEPNHEAVAHITRRHNSTIDPQDRALAEAIAEIFAAKEKADRESQQSH